MNSLRVVIAVKMNPNKSKMKFLKVLISHNKIVRGMDNFLDSRAKYQIPTSTHKRRSEASPRSLIPHLELKPVGVLTSNIEIMLIS